MPAPWVAGEHTLARRSVGRCYQIATNFSRYSKTCQNVPA